VFTACGIMYRRCCRPAASSVHYTTSCNTQSNAHEDGRNYRPKHVELIGIINKLLFLHLVGCLYYYIINNLEIRQKCKYFATTAINHVHTNNLRTD
jgi:hypothetical protein